jgi:dihydroorotase
MSSELLQQVRVLDPVSQTDQVADILIGDGMINTIQNNINDCCTDTIVRDCHGMVLGPGLIDLYSYSGEPGYEERETLDSLMEAASMGGFTRVAILPKTNPPLDNPGALAFFHQRLGYSSLSRGVDSEGKSTSLYFWGALTMGVEGKQMTELGELAKTDIIGFTDGLPLDNLLFVRRVLEYVKPLNKPIAFWPCDRALVSNGVMREGGYSTRLGLPGNPTYSETSALAALLEIVETIGTPVHIMRVSTARSVELIRAAKERGVPITASTTWMHLLLETKAISNYDPNLRLDPPLGNSQDRLGLIRGVKEGIIDAIAINHCPYTYEEKTVAFADAPPGAIGLELALPLLWQELVETGELTALELWQALSTKPAHCLGQNPSIVQEGNPTELTLFSPQKNWTVERKNLKSLSVNTPWLGNQLTGKVVKIFKST